MKKHIKKCQIYQIEPFKFNNFHFKIIVDTIKLKILYLKNFLNSFNFKKDKIFYFSNGKLNFWVQDYFINEDVNLYSILIKKFKNKNFKDLSKQAENLNFNFLNSLTSTKSIFLTIKSHIRNIQNSFSKKKNPLLFLIMVMIFLIYQKH